MNRVRRNSLAYILAVVLTLATFLVRWGVSFYVERPILILFTVPILISAYAGGLGPGLLATALSGLGTGWLFLFHRFPGESPVSELLQWCILLAVGSLISLLSEARRRAARLAEQAQREKNELLARQAEAALFERDERLRFHLENSPLALIEWDRDFRVTRWSRGAERIFGWSEPEVLGKHPGEFGLVDEADREAVDRIMAPLTTNRGQGLTSANRNRRKDGDLIHCEWHNSALLDSEGQVASYLSLAQDVTERKRAEAELRRTNQALSRVNERLAEADRRKDEFLAMLAHELRNPLAPVRNAVKIMQLSCIGACEGAGRMQRQREIIDRQVTHMARLLDDLLDVSRVTRGKIILKKQPVALAELLPQALDTVQPHLEARGLALHYTPPPEGLRVEADWDRLLQIVGNLLTNAAKYTDDGGQIWLSAEAEGAEAVLRVRDSGMGIAPEMLGRIFDLFAQIEGGLDRAQGGLGIGLTMVRSLVQMHGGTIEARSAGLGQGSEFIVRLPALAGAAEAAEAAAGVEGGGHER